MDPAAPPPTSDSEASVPERQCPVCYTDHKLRRLACWHYLCRVCRPRCALCPICRHPDDGSHFDPDSSDSECEKLVEVPRFRPMQRPTQIRRTTTETTTEVIDLTYEDEPPLQRRRLDTPAPAATAAPQATATPAAPSRVRAGCRQSERLLTTKFTVHVHSADFMLVHDALNSIGYFFDATDAHVYSRGAANASRR